MHVYCIYCRAWESGGGASAPKAPPVSTPMHFKHASPSSQTPIRQSIVSWNHHHIGDSPITKNPPPLLPTPSTHLTGLPSHVYIPMPTSFYNLYQFNPCTNSQFCKLISLSQCHIMHIVYHIAGNFCIWSIFTISWFNLCGCAHSYPLYTL